MSGGNTTQGIQAGAIVINILGNNNQLNSVVNQTQQTLQKFKDGVGKLKIPGFQGIMATFRDLTVTFTSLTSSLRTLIAPLRQSATVFMSFDYNMSKVQAITGATAEQIAELREQAKLLGKTTFFTASQVADAQKFLAMAGFDPEKIKAALPNILNLALAGDMDIGMAADIATNISTPFKIAAQDLNRVNDVLAAVASSSNTNVLEMGQAFKYAAPAASAAGQSIEELGAAFAVLANNGLKADMAGTSVRMMLIKLTDEGVRNKLKEQFNIDVMDGNKIKPLMTILRELNEATKGMNKADKISTFFKTFDARAGNAAIALATAGNAIDEFREKTDKAAGTADKMAQTMANNLKGDWIAFKSAIEGVQIAIGEAINDTARGWLQRLTSLTRGLIEIFTTLREISATPFKLMHDYIKQATQAVTNFISSGANTIAWVRNIGTSIRDTFSATFGNVIELFNQNRIGDAVRMMWLQIQLEFEQGRLYVTNQMNEVVAALTEPFMGISAIFTNIWQWISDTASQVASYISETWGNEMNWLSEFFGSWWSYICDGWNALQNDLGAVIVGGWWSIATGINNAISGIETFWNDLITGIQESALFAVRFLIRQFAWAYAKIRGLNPEDVMNDWTAGIDDMIVGVESRSQNRATEIESGKQQWKQSIDDAANRSLNQLERVRANAPKTNERIENLKIQIDELKKPILIEGETVNDNVKDKNKEIENAVTEMSDYDSAKKSKSGKEGLSGTFSAFEMGNVTGNLIEDVLNKQLKLQQETNRLLKQMYEEGGGEYA